MLAVVAMTPARRTQLLSWGTLATTIVQLVLSVFIVLLYLRITHDANAQNVLRCEQSNAFRRGDLQLWEHVLGVSSQSPQPAETAAERRARAKQVADFRGFITRHDALTDCSAAG